MNHTKSSKSNSDVDNEGCNNGVLGYLICTQQGLPLLSRQYPLASSLTSSSSTNFSTHSSSHWKAVAQYICLSAGFWTSKTAPFSFSLSAFTYYVTVLPCGDKFLYSCVEIPINLIQAHDKYPSLLSYYLGWKLIRHCFLSSPAALSHLLHDIHQKTEEVLREGTFSDSIGTNQDEFWEEFLSEHEIHDQFLAFEEQYLVRAVSDVEADYSHIFHTVGRSLYNGTFTIYHASEDDQQTLYPLATAHFTNGEINPSIDVSFSTPWKLRVEKLLRQGVLEECDRLSASIWLHDELSEYCAIYYSIQNSILITMSDIPLGQREHHLKAKLLDDGSLYVCEEFPDPFTDVIELLLTKYVDSCYRK